MTYTCIIIDDEEPARKRLRRMLEEFKHVIEVVDEAKDGFEALDKIETNHPQIIFLDIQMPGMSGFEVLTKLEHIPIVIFTTAYEQYALKAFETNAIDYLLKPVEKERLHATLQKIERLIGTQSKEKIAQLLDIVNQMKPINEVTSLPVKVKDRIILVRLTEIAYLEAKDKYVSIWTTECKEHITDVSLKTIEDKLPENFLRVHRAFIVNKNHVLEVQKYFHGKLIIMLNDRNFTKITCSSSYSEQVKKSLEIL